MFSIYCMKNINHLYTKSQKNTVEKDLVNVLEEEKRQKKLAVEGKTYVCNTHDIDKVVDMIEKILYIIIIIF